MKKEIIELGTFEVVSTILRISDPCYDKKTWCAGVVHHVLPGTWKAQVLKKTEDNWGHRCRKLCAVHESFDKSKITVKKLKIDVGVDSGCCGIFDDQFYNVDFETEQPMNGQREYNQHDFDRMFEESKRLREATETILKAHKKDLNEYPFLLDREDKPYQADLSFSKEWGDVASDVTFSNVGAGVIRNGVCSRSGYGDGSYTAYAAYDKNDRVVGVKILF